MVRLEGVLGRVGWSIGPLTRTGVLGASGLLVGTPASFLGERHT
jgi:hypothetical protein